MSLTLRIASIALAAALACAGPAMAQLLYWVDTNYGAPFLRSARPDGSNLKTLALDAGSLPEGLAVDATQHRLYWVESKFTGGRMHRTDLALAGETSFLAGASCMRGVAVDAAGGKVYWTTSNLVTGASVRRANLDGTSAQTLLTLPAGSNPRGIALDVVPGKIYVADFDLNVIRVMNLDGTSPGTVPIVGGVISPYGLSLDAVNHRLYWTEYPGRIRRANADGSGVVNLFSGLGQPTYLALDLTGAKMYWVETAVSGRRIRQANIDGSGTATTLPLTMSTFGGIAFVPGTIVDVAPTQLPLELALGQPVPNPSSRGTSVELALPVAAHVRAVVTDVQGRTVAVLANGVEPAGRRHLAWSGTLSGRRAAPGVYFLRVEALGKAWTRRVIVER